MVENLYKQKYIKYKKKYIEYKKYLGGGIESKITKENLEQHTDGNTINQLVNLDINCEGFTGINNLKLNRNQKDKKIFYNYGCDNTHKSLTYKKSKTNETPYNTGSILNLASHDINCKDQPIAKINLTRTLPPDTISYDYKCANITLDKDNINMTTPFNDQYSNGSNIYLDRHSIKCPDKTVLSRIQLEKESNIPNSKIRYKYICKKMQKHIPKPVYYHPTNLDQSSLDKSYEYTIITDNNININNPYIDTEINRTNQPKINIFNQTKKYNTMPPLNSPKAYLSENEHMTNAYCDRMPDYPDFKLRPVRFVSYNVHNFVKQCITKTNPKNGKDIKYSLETISKLKSDILFLQEIVPEYTPFPKDSKENSSGNGNFRNLIDKLNTFEYKYYFIGDTHYSTEKSALDVTNPYFMLCNATFSKFPIIKQYSIGLGSNRICIHCIIDFPDYYISTYNVHIEFRNTLDTKRNIPYKFTQINKLAKYIYDSSILINSVYNDKPVFYILGGDFNNQYTDFKDLFSPLISIMTKLNPQLLSKDTDNKKLFTAQNTQKILDMFFIAGPSNYQYNQIYDIIPDSNSDHYPILYDFIPLLK
jgi:hypothetical protein